MRRRGSAVEFLMSIYYNLTTYYRSACSCLRMRSATGKRALEISAAFGVDVKSINTPPEASLEIVQLIPSDSSQVLKLSDNNTWRYAYKLCESDYRNTIGLQILEFLLELRRY